LYLIDANEFRVYNFRVEIFVRVVFQPVWFFLPFL